MEQPSIWLREIITPWNSAMHGATSVVDHRRTLFQQLTIIDTGAYGRTLFLDGICQSCEADEFIYHETLVHPACAAVANPIKVLILGGGEGATLREVLRWPSVQSVTMVDLDSGMIAAAKEHLFAWHQGSFDDPRATVIVGDAVAFLDTTTERFDVVISDMTDPTADGPATFCFTEQYYAAVKAVLTPGGTIAVQAGPMAPAEIDNHAKVARTIARVFAHWVSYPCIAPCYGRPLGFIVASDASIVDRMTPSATAAIEPLGLRYFTPDHLRGLLSTPKFVLDAISSDVSYYSDSAPPALVGSAGWTWDTSA
jgi:spermidine synthase